MILHYLTDIDTFPNNSNLLLKDVTQKLCALFCLLSGQRCQTIASLNLNFSYHSNGKIAFALRKVMKTTKLITYQQLIEYYSYQENKKLLVVNFLREYTRRIELIRENIEGQPSR